MLGTERAEAAGGARRGGDGGPRPGGVDGLDAGGDQVLADRLLIRLGEQVVDLGVGGGGDAPQDLGRVVVACLDALEVEDREATQAGQLAGHPHVDDGVHGRSQDRDGEVDATERLAEVDVGRLDRVRARRQRDVLEAVGRPDGIDLRMEDTARGRGGRRRRLGSLDHVALLCRLTVGLPSIPSLPADPGRGRRAGRDSVTSVRRAGQPRRRTPGRPRASARTRRRDLDPRGRRGCVRWPSGSPAR